MNATIITTPIQYNEKEFIIVQISGSSSNIGVCSVPIYNTGKYKEVFYMGEDAIISILPGSLNGIYADKIIQQNVGRDKSTEKLKKRLNAACDNYFEFNQPIAKALSPFFELLSDGVYIVHESNMIPTDGAGHFFWNAYLSKHEFLGSAEIAHKSRKNEDHSPCFLVPTCSMSEFTDSTYKSHREAIKSGQKRGGLAFYLTGSFAALLDGHHVAAACMMEDREFPCLVVEPVLGVTEIEYTDDSGEVRTEQALYSPYVKMPLSIVPSSMIEAFLIKRRREKPRAYEKIAYRSHILMKMPARKILPDEFLSKAESLPDLQMVSSTRSITSLSDEQLEALLNGETHYNGKVIVTENFYTSIVNACNFLQLTDFDRFLKFGIRIMQTPELTAIHQYLAERFMNINNSSILQFFRSVIEDESLYKPDIVAIAKRYDFRYGHNYEERSQEELKENFSKAQKVLQAKAEVEQNLNALERFKRLKEEAEAAAALKEKNNK